MNVIKWRLITVLISFLILFIAGFGIAGSIVGFEPGNKATAGWFGFWHTSGLAALILTGAGILVSFVVLVCSWVMPLDRK